MLQGYPMYAYIPAKDLARARRFYEDRLGLKAGEETGGGVVYEFGQGTACFLYPTPNAGTSQASQAFWAVDDVDRLILALKARGVVFEDYDLPGEKSPAGPSPRAAPRRPGSRTARATSWPWSRTWARPGADPGAGRCQAPAAASRGISKDMRVFAPSNGTIAEWQKITQQRRPNSTTWSS